MKLENLGLLELTTSETLEFQGGLTAVQTVETYVVTFGVAVLCSVYNSVTSLSSGISSGFKAGAK